jgi:hypothetical protein
LLGNLPDSCVYNEFDSSLWGLGFGQNPDRQRLVGYGYDPESYIATAKLTPSQYATQALIIAKIGGMSRLIESCDDSVPPIGNLNPTIGNSPVANPAYLAYQAVIQTVVTELNGYLSSIYPIPLAQTGTVAILQVVSVDTTGAVTAIKVLDTGNYCTAPDVNQTPAYLRHTDPLANVNFWGANWAYCQTGSGLAVTAAYATVNYSDESGQVLQAYAVNGTPVIANGGTGYQANDILVLTGGSSFVPAKVRQACLDLICHTLYKRRLAPDEKNPFSTLAKYWRDLFVQIGEGQAVLDGTYKRNFSAGMAWTQPSVVFGANSL